MVDGKNVDVTHKSGMVVFANNEDYGLKGELTTRAGMDLFIGLRPPFIALKFKKDLQIDRVGKFLE